MSNIKQVIVMRKDLNMRKGKMCAQAAHASMKFLVDKMTTYEEDTEQPIVRMSEFDFSTAEAQWLVGDFTKIVLGVDSEVELLQIQTMAVANGVHCDLIQDKGFTEFHGVPTYTCLALGPDEAEKIDVITGHLKPL